MSFDTQLLHIEDVKATGTDGGNGTASAWNTRDLNTVVTNEITGASLAANVITLPAGTYYCEATSPYYRTVGNTTRLYDTTNTAVLLYGLSGYSDGNPGRDQESSEVHGRFTLAGSTNIELQMIPEGTTAGTESFGRADNTLTVTTQQLYSVIKIWKI